MELPEYKRKYPHLFTPLTVGRVKKVTYKNRVLVGPIGPMGISLDAIGRLTDAGVDQYGRHARGGFASVCIPYEVPYCGGHSRTLSLDPKEDGLYFIHNVQRVIHGFGAKSMCEIYHPGMCMIEACGEELISADSFIYNGRQVRAMNEEDMERVTTMYVEAAKLARRAGFDGLTLHYGHGWLMHNFLCPLTNHRKDKYGGSVENRVRFPRSVLERIREAVPDMVMELRMCGSDKTEGGIEIPDAVEQALLFQDVVDMIHVTSGGRTTALSRARQSPSYFSPAAVNAPATEAFKKGGVRVPVGIIGAVHDPQIAEKLLADGVADYVLMARQVIADNDWMNKVREGREEDIRPCLRCSYCLDGGRRGKLTAEVNITPDFTTDAYCSVNPLYIQGNSLPRFFRPTTGRKVAVIGGGVAGMQAALSADANGHHVTLFEKSSRLGGQLNVYPDDLWFKKQMVAFRKYMVRQIEKSGVGVVLNKSVTPEEIAGEKFDVAIVATGSRQAVPPIPGIHGDNVVMAWDAFTYEGKPGGHLVVVGGGSVGCEVALFLSEKGYTLTVVEMTPYIASNSEVGERTSLIEQLEKHGITILENTLCTQITEKGVVVRGKDGVERELPADGVVVSAGSAVSVEERDAFENAAFDVYYVGDCDGGEANVRHAVNGAWCVGNRI